MFEEKIVDEVLNLSKTAIKVCKNKKFHKEIQKIQDYIMSNNKRATYDDLKNISKLKMSEIVEICTSLEARGAIHVVPCDENECVAIAVVNEYKFL